MKYKPVGVNQHREFPLTTCRQVGSPCQWILSSWKPFSVQQRLYDKLEPLIKSSMNPAIAAGSNNLHRKQLSAKDVNSVPGPFQLQYCNSWWRASTVFAFKETETGTIKTRRSIKNAHDSFFRPTPSCTLLIERLYIYTCCSWDEVVSPKFVSCACVTWAYQYMYKQLNVGVFVTILTLYSTTLTLPCTMWITAKSCDIIITFKVKNWLVDWLD